MPRRHYSRLRRLNNLTRKLKKSETLEEYDTVIKEQLSQGVVQRAPDTVVGQECYISHKAVVREKAEGTKLRIVYDASAEKCEMELHPSMNASTLVHHCKISSGVC